VVSLKPSFNALSKYFEALQRRDLWMASVRVGVFADGHVVMSLLCTVERIRKAGLFIDDGFVVGRTL
jgi:hypothetical protein